MDDLRDLKLVDRYRDRERLRPSPYNDPTSRRPGGNKSPPFHRIFISNIPYEEKWQDLKDLFRDKVGEVTYVELVRDDAGKSKGFGIVEFKTKELAVQAVEKMKGHTIRDRNLVVKEDFYGDHFAKAVRRDALNNPQPLNIDFDLGPPVLPLQERPSPMLDHRIPQNISIGDPKETVDQQILKITGGVPLGRSVFVANLDYTVTYPKLKEVFSMAGNVEKIDLHLDNENKSRGMATITFENEFGALQAISMFNQQILYDRRMVVKMDRESTDKILPSGLQGVGPSLNLPGLKNTLGSKGGMEYGDLPSNGSSSVGNFDQGFPSKTSLGLNFGAIPKAQVGASNYSNMSPSLELMNSTHRDGIGSSYGGGSPGLTNNRTINSIVAALGLDNVGHGTQQYGISQGLQQSSSSRLGLSYLDRERALIQNQSLGIDRNLSGSRTSNSSSGTWVYVVNLPYSVTWKELKEIFSEVGTVLYSQVKMENGKSKGQAYVRFQTSEQAARAVQKFHNHEIEGRSIKVRLDDPK